jgi:protein strawberry notch
MSPALPAIEPISSAPVTCPSSDLGNATLLFHAAELLLAHLSRGKRIDAVLLRGAMEQAFGASDATGAWDWKSAYDACEAATVLSLRKFGHSMRAKAASPTTLLPMLDRLAALLPTHTRRSLESETLQQFSTPITLGLAAVTAAGIRPGDRVLEPSAGTGLLAVLAQLAGGSLILNDYADTRAALLSSLFPDGQVTRFDAAMVNDLLDPLIIPSVVLMNPPFSALANVEHRTSDATVSHVVSALARLPRGGRLVAITGANFSAENPSFAAAFARIRALGHVVFTAAIDGKAYAKHGTTVDTRLTVIDRGPTENPVAPVTSVGIAPDAATLLAWVIQHVPPRKTASVPAATPTMRSARAAISGRRTSLPKPQMSAASVGHEAVELVFEPAPEKSANAVSISDALYESYSLQSIRIPGALPHPSKLVQSAAMASVAPPVPTYRPHILPNVLSDGLLSDAQFESVIHAGEAHSAFLAGSWMVDATFDQVTAASDDAQGAVRFRRGWFLGDGTGAGKGRQVAGVLVDNWLKGRRRAVWVSKSDKLLEDAQRDWSALGMERLLVTPLSRFRQGTPIRLAEGILFTTYATLRSDARDDKASRVQQIVDWLGPDFDGVIVFDEAHAMQNAAGGRGERGDVASSQQGRAGLRLQHALANARILYVSATGATTVHNLAYAQRLGLWGGEDFPFATRAEFVEAIEAGGVAAMEVLARDLKALGLYAARSLSYEGVAYEMVEHRLTDAQVGIYDAYARAFAIIHNNLDAAMKATNITGSTGTLNARAKSAARSAFESAKQRFFNHLITSMKTPTLIASVRRDLEAGHASVIQIVSTGEALTERRLAEIPTEDWGDVQVDVTPREYVLDYLAHSFPVQLFEPYSDKEGNILSRPVMRDGQPVENREAVALRDALIERLAALAPVPGALDQIVQHFGTEQVAEITGRSRRIVRKRSPGRTDRLAVENRAGSANLAEAQAFMDDAKRILVFSDAGGTGRSYHAELSAKNQRLRVHYLLEAGWKADAAIQGLGRTNRTNQAQPPLFRPVATNVKAEKRFLSTIARRLDTLGAITKGQRQTGGHGLFRPEDNLESHYARDALRQLYVLLVGGKIDGCTLEEFESATGLKLCDSNGLKDELPPITTFLNRLLALTIDLQNVLFAAFEQLLTARIDGAITSGTFDLGLETLTAERFTVNSRHIIYTHPTTGADTRLLSITESRRNRPILVDQAIDLLSDPRAVLLINRQSGRAAVQVPTTSIMLDDGSIEHRVRLIRPIDSVTMPVATMPETRWTKASRATFTQAWLAEVKDVPEFTAREIHIVTGLLLPIWKRLPEQSSRVYRLQTDTGERIIGRLVTPAWAASATDTGTFAAPTPEAVFTALMDGKTIFDLSDGLQLRRVRVMAAQRIELSGFTDGMRERLSAYGLFHEIISWKLRMFVATDESGIPVLARLLERFPVQRIGDRAAS